MKSILDDWRKSIYWTDPRWFDNLISLFREDEQETTRRKRK